MLLSPLSPVRGRYARIEYAFTHRCHVALSIPVSITLRHFERVTLCIIRRSNLSIRLRVSALFYPSDISFFQRLETIVNHFSSMVRYTRQYLRSARGIALFAFLPYLFTPLLCTIVLCPGFSEFVKGASGRSLFRLTNSDSSPSVVYIAKRISGTGITRIVAHRACRMQRVPRS